MHSACHHTLHHSGKHRLFHCLQDFIISTDVLVEQSGQLENIAIWCRLLHDRLDLSNGILDFVIHNECLSFKNHDRFIHLGIAIAALRKMRGMSQEQLAEKAGISRSLISAIEAPGLAKSFSLDVFFNLADALDIDPADLINATVFPDRIFKQK